MATRRLGRTLLALAGATAVLSLASAAPVAADTSVDASASAPVVVDGRFAMPDGVEWTLVVGGDASGSSVISPDGVEWTLVLDAPRGHGGVSPNGVEWTE
jgi:hypothetical protein